MFESKKKVEFFLNIQNLKREENINKQLSFLCLFYSMFFLLCLK